MFIVYVFKRNGPARQRPGVLAVSGKVLRRADDLELDRVADKFLVEAEAYAAAKTLDASKYICHVQFKQWG